MQRGGARTRWTGIDPALRDWWPVAAVLLLQQLPVGMTGVVPSSSVVTVAFSIGIALPLRWRRTHTFWVCSALAAVAVLQVIVTGPTLRFGAFIALLLASFAAGAHETVRRGATGVAILLASAAVTSVFDGPVNPVEFVFPVVYLGGAFAVGVAVRRQRGTAERLAELAESLRQEREESARLAAVAERMHIAREVHDIVAHSLGVMVVQAEAAAELLEDDAPAGRPLSVVQRTGRQALDELRGVLGALRDRDLTHEPQPGIAQLPRLVEDMRAAGLSVTVDVSGPVDGLPDGLQLAVFRIVQEALTNALKHGQRALVSASVGVSRDEVHVRVVVPTASAAEGAGGYGLIGMRERAAMHGGHVTAGVQAGKGFTVEARMPITSATS